MNQKSYMEKLEDVLFALEIKTFDAPLTLNYRFGAFEAEMGLFRCFACENDIKREGDYIELAGLQIYWIALDYPDYGTVFDNILEISNKCCKVMGRMHTATFILALENGLPSEEEQKLQEAFTRYINSLLSGTYQSIEIWDVKMVDEKYQKFVEAEV